jgi:hypothetical protein
MIGPFEFSDGGRTYNCQIRPPSGSIAEAWWWFEVSGDQQWYAPFRAAGNDTKASVRARVVAFYMNRLARLAEPAAARYQRGRPPGSGETKPAAESEGSTAS